MRYIWCLAGSQRDAWDIHRIRPTFCACCLCGLRGGGHLRMGYGELRRFVSALYISTLVWRLAGFFVPFPSTFNWLWNGSLVVFLNIISQRLFSLFCNEIPFVLRSGYCGLYGICGFVSVYVLIFEHLGTFFNFSYWTWGGRYRGYDIVYLRLSFLLL
jgi:hypothetical protein